MLTVLFIGLIMLNISIVFPDILHERIGVAYSVSTVVISLIYIIISNLFSVFLISENIILYTILELVTFICLLAVFSIIAFFSKRTAEDIRKDEAERVFKDSMNSQLMEIESCLIAWENDASIMPIINSFKILKERINASTPFGRIDGNNKVKAIESKIKGNLQTLLFEVQANYDNEKLNNIQKLIDDTKRLVINRETLNIK